MTNVALQDLALDNYAHVLVEVGSWMDFPDAGGDGCDCGGPPPPQFRILPPPPPPPGFLEDDPSPDAHDCPPVGQETCPALLISTVGDEPPQEALEPPLAALVVAVVTFLFIFVVAAFVCWRFRRRHRFTQRRRSSPSSKSCSGDFVVNGSVIYDDLPIAGGPHSRIIGADPHTLAPMELQDLKLNARTLESTQGGPLLQPYGCPPMYTSSFRPPPSPKGPPTYEEILTGSETTSVSSSGSSRGRGLPSITDWGPRKTRSIGNRRGTSSRRSLAPQSNIGTLPCIVPTRGPFTIQGTSDGRTSTSSSSEHQGEASRGSRYYVGGLSPGTPPAQDASPIEQGTLPPLPSRSDRYRIYFTSEGRKRAPGLSSPRMFDTGRKRQRCYDAASALENEPLYHEL